MIMNYAKINRCDLANGAGVRVSLFVSGCCHHCKGCFNQAAWDYDYGEPFTDKSFAKIITEAESKHIKGLSVLGGEPLDERNRDCVLNICKDFNTIFRGDKDIWLYTGYVYDDIKDLPVMQYIDVLVDGPYVEELRDLSLPFRGSSNQRIIDVKRSIFEGHVVLKEM